jgi:hypothetical protein
VRRASASSRLGAPRALVVARIVARARSARGRVGVWRRTVVFRRRAVRRRRAGEEGRDARCYSDM